jgi:hypothetical protein
MAAGDIINSKRPRFVPNERLDTIDGIALSEAPLKHDDVRTRSLLITPKATAAQPVGMILTGGSTTNNPTGAGDGKLRINTELLVAMDADGRHIIKKSGVVVDVTIPVGLHNVYLYHLETAADTQKRRFIGVNSPFAETGGNMETVFEGGYGVHTKTGAIVAEDVVNGATRALVYLGAANNAAGTVTFDGTLTTNRLSTVETPGSAPASNVANGSDKTVLDLVKRALYRIGRSVYKGSNHLTPAAGNNHGAYTEHSGLGVDAAGRYVYEDITIGDGTTTFGRLDRNAYASDDLLMQAAVDLIPTNGTGIIRLKPGLDLSGNWPATVTISTRKTVIIEGSGAPGDGKVQMGTSTAVAMFTVTHALTKIIFRNLYVSITGLVEAKLLSCLDGGFEMHNCRVSHGSSHGTAMVEIGAASALCSGIRVKNCTFNATPVASTTSPWFLSGGTEPVRDVLIEGCLFTCDGSVSPAILLNGARDSIRIVNNHFRFTDDDGGNPASDAYAIVLGEDATATGEWGGRVIENCSFQGSETLAGNSHMCGVDLSNAPGTLVLGCAFVNCYRGIRVGTTNGQEFQEIRDCLFAAPTSGNRGDTRALVAASAALTGLRVAGCRFLATKVYLDTGSGNIVRVTIEHCAFIDINTGNNACQILTTGFIAELTVSDNDFLEITKSADNVQGLTVGVTSGPSSVLNTKICRNRFQGFYHKGSQNTFYAIKVVGQDVQNLEIADNLFDEINNVAVVSTYGAANVPRVVELGFNSAAGIRVAGNRLRDFMSTLSIGGGGGVLNNGSFLWIDSYDGSATMGVVSAIHIDANEIGADALSPSGLFTVTTRFRFRDIRFTNNRVEQNVSLSAAIFTFLQSIIDVGTLPDSNATRLLEISDNYLRMITPAGAYGDTEYIRLTNGGASTVLMAVKLVDNVFSVTNITVTSPNVILACQRVNAFMVFGNMAFKDGDTGTSALATVSVPTTTDNVLPTLPGAGILFTQNIRVGQS